MLTRIQIKNFRCLREVDVPLKPLTVLIGQNNTGKSAFLQAFSLIGSITGVQNAGGSQRGAKVEDNDRWEFSSSNAPVIVGDVSGNEQVQVSEVRITEAGFWTLTGNNADLLPMSLFSDTSKRPEMTSKGADERQGIPRIDDKISNVPAFLDVLLRKDRHRFDKIINSLRSLIPGFNNLNIETPSADRRRIDLVLENGLVMDAKYASHGVKLIIFFVALANHPLPPKTILIEEPETGVHPKRLDDIVRLLRGLSVGTYADHKTQVILSTHSPYLLDCIQPDSDQVLVFEQLPDGSRTARPVDTERLKGFLDEFMLGEVWYNQEEAGLVEKAT